MVVKKRMFLGLFLDILDSRGRPPAAACSSSSQAHAAGISSAEQALREKLRDCERTFGTSDPAIVKHLIALASFLYQDSQPSLAVEVYLRYFTLLALTASYIYAVHDLLSQLF